MNFYEHQAQARKQTRRLVFLFTLAVLLIVLAVDAVVLLVLGSAEATDPSLPWGEWLQQHWTRVLFTSLSVLGVVVISSLYKSAVLREGGGVVARGLGGVRVERTAQDPLQRRLFNVVEEMAIASGVPVPEIYVLEHEDSINAFAAGHLPANAAIAVTRGALEQLSRAELQGVIAHEFGHVLNGDMRLNTRLIGLLFGLLVIAIVGRTVLRFTPRSSGRKRGGGAILVAALAVMVLGYIGLFFGRLIQAAVSRQRERLADASAVQFTREPQGLKGALVKIGAAAGPGSRLHDTGAEEVAHMLFAPGMERLFATHPPLIERIRTLDRSFDESEFKRVKFEPQRVSEREVEKPDLHVNPLDALVKAGVGPAVVAQLVGNPGTTHIEDAQVVVQSLPAGLLAGLGNPEQTLGVLFALVLDAEPQVRQRQLFLIKEKLGTQGVSSIMPVQAQVDALKPEQRLPVLHSLVPELRRLPRGQRRRILETLGRLILIDGQISVFEYSLAALARVYLQDELQIATQGRRLKLDEVRVELQALFATLARHGAADEEQARRAYESGIRHVLSGEPGPYKPIPGWTAALDRALRCLDRLPPAGKEQLIEGLAMTVIHDGKLAVQEAELLRAICASIHCPLPPLTLGPY